MSAGTHGLALTPAEGLLRLRGVDVTPCTECGVCSDVCPVLSWMDVAPAELMIGAKKGAGQELLAHGSLWVCIDCRRCSESCPVGIDVARAMEGLRSLAHDTGRAPAQDPILRFHELFLREVARRGRLHGLSLMWRSRHLIRGWPRKLGLPMVLLAKGKLPFREGRPVAWPGPQALGGARALSGPEPRANEPVERSHSQGEQD